MLTILDWILIAVGVVGIVGGGLYMLSRYAQRKMSEQQQLIGANSQKLTIYTISKKRDKISNSGMPKAVTDQMPKRANLMKMYFVKAKVGTQIMTFMVMDKNVYNAIPLKKNVKISASGMYITSVEGMKTKKEMKELEKVKKAKNKGGQSHDSKRKQ